jgi:ATP-dependent Clp protease ATP-binding subunit ClpB
MVYGARPLKRVVQRDILNPLASRILSGDVKEGSRVRVDVEGRKLVFLTAVREPAVLGEGGRLNK